MAKTYSSVDAECKYYVSINIFSYIKTKLTPGFMPGLFCTGTQN